MLNRAKVQQIQRELAAAMEEIGRRHGVKLGKNSARYTENYAELKVRVDVVSGGVAMTPERVALDRIYPGRYGTIVRSPTGERLKIIGYKPRNRKYPVIVENPRGRRLKAPQSYINLPSA